MANSVYIRIPTCKKNTFYGSCTELGTLVFIRLRETAEKRERKSGLSEADRWPSSTLYKLLLHIILGYLVDDGRRPRRRGVGVVRPRFDRDQRRRIIFYPTGLIDGRLLCVFDRFLLSFSLWSDFFTPPPRHPHCTQSIQSI